jgi:hypothetical protein
LKVAPYRDDWVALWCGAQERHEESFVIVFCSANRSGLKKLTRYESGA